MTLTAKISLAAVLSAVSAPAEVIRGAVIENLTCKPLARAQARTNSHGAFAFRSLLPGAYLVRAARNNFMPAEYGQKRWNSSRTPAILDEKHGLFLNIRLLRYSAINGTLVDENDEGLPAHNVLAYRNSRPPELIAHATSDERCVYRLHGLPPGTYIVRTAGDQSNEASYLPTYSKETEQLDQARVVELLPDQEANDVDVRPIEGRLYSLSVDVKRIPPGADASITLVSETGRKTVKASSYRFTHLPPGAYEAFAQSPADPEPGDKVIGAYQRLSLGADSGVSLMLHDPSGVSISGAPADAGAQSLTLDAHSALTRDLELYTIQ